MSDDDGRSGQTNRRITNSVLVRLMLAQSIGNAIDGFVGHRKNEPGGLAIKSDSLMTFGWISSDQFRDTEGDKRIAVEVHKIKSLLRDERVAAC